VLVSRDADGKVHEKDNAHTVGIGTVLGAAGGFFVGLIFPPALLASTVVGAGIGAGAGGLVSHYEKKEIKAEVANDLPFGSSGIVVLLDERWVADAEKALSKADRVSRHKVDKHSVEHAKTKAPKPTPTGVAERPTKRLSSSHRPQDCGSLRPLLLARAQRSLDPLEASVDPLLDRLQLCRSGHRVPFRAPLFA
jgi:uncharacterized membrane protein